MPPRKKPATIVPRIAGRIGTPESPRPIRPPSIPREAARSSTLPIPSPIATTTSETSIVNDQTPQCRLYSRQASPIAPSRTVGQAVFTEAMLGLLFQKRFVANAVFIPPSIVSPIQSETRPAAPGLFAIESQLLRQHARIKGVKSVVGPDLAGATRQLIS